MFEKETKFIYDLSMNHVKQLGSYMTFDQLAAGNLHPAIIKYISAEIDYLLYEDRQRLLSSSNFDYSGEEINKYFNLIGREIKKNRKFSLDHIGDLVLHAVSFTVNYLAQPNWSLIKLIFARDRVLKSAEVLQILKYVYYYGYTASLIEKYIIKKNLIAVDRAELEELLLKADREIFGDSPSKLVEIALLNMGEFSNIGSVSKTRIPLLMFELYLKEKHLNDYWDKLAASLGSDVKQTYEISELRKIINSPLFIRKDSRGDALEDDRQVGLLGLKTGNENDNDILNHGQEPENTDPDEKAEEADELELEAPFIMPDDLVFDSSEDFQEDVNPADEKQEDKKQEDEIINSGLPDDEPADETDVVSSPEADQTIDSGIPDEQTSGGDLTDTFIIDLDESPDSMEIQPENEDQPETDEIILEAEAGEEIVAEIDPGPSEAEETLLNITDTGDEDSPEPPFSDAEDEAADEYKENNELYQTEPEAEQEELQAAMPPFKRDKDISEFFSAREMRKITSGIFQEDIKSLAQTFDSVSKCSSYAEAEDILNTLFREKNVSPDSKLSRTLLKNIHKYFQQD